MLEELKRYSSLGCCGIDCGLCPRFYTKGDSACPGCGGVNFKEKHPSCGIHSCCSIKKGLEVCSTCDEYPCKRFDGEKEGYDSFVTHQKIFANHELIKDNGLDYFINQQSIRMDILNKLLSDYDEGRSKSYFCICCALLPIDKLTEAMKFADDAGNSLSTKEKNTLIKNKLQHIANELGVTLKLKRKV